MAESQVSKARAKIFEAKA